MPQPHQQTDPSKTSTPRTIRCAKCRAGNSAARNTCQSCGAHLFVICRSCGHGNPRAESRCDSCGESLHRSAAAKLFKRVNERRTKFPLWQIALILAVVPAAFKLIMTVISSMSASPPPE